VVRLAARTSMAAAARMAAMAIAVSTRAERNAWRQLLRPPRRLGVLRNCT
jgi:hypothetical protein